MDQELFHGAILSKQQEKELSKNVSELSPQTKKKLYCAPHSFQITKTQILKARFFLVHDTKTGKSVPNEHKMYRMVIKYPKYIKKSYWT
jgi:hypothetical protein